MAINIEGDMSATAVDYRQFYSLEPYLFETVRRKFQEDGFLSAFDFFCIVIWKANRAKSKTAERLLAQNCRSLDAAVAALTSGLAKQGGDKEKLRYLFEKWGFRISMASAILTVLYPDEFTVYDKRVCNQLPKKEMHLRLDNKLNFEEVWKGYSAFRKAVKDFTIPNVSGLRDRDRHLWGKDFYEQLRTDMKNGFEDASRVVGQKSA